MPLLCPKCQDSELRIPAGRATSVTRCYRCHGMWLTPDEMEGLAVSGTLLDPESLLPQRMPQDFKAAICPLGHGLMSRARVELDDPFYLERCRHCGGIWFDSGEWNQLATSHLVHHLRDLWDPRWQRRMRQERADQIHDAKLKELLGEDTLAEIDRLAQRLNGHPELSLAIARLFDRARRPD